MDKQKPYVELNCPFCKKKDQFRIHRTKSLYHCMNCKQGGDGASFLKLWMLKEKGN
jgi:ribosomal protein L37AE/L43A